MLKRTVALAAAISSAIICCDLTAKGPVYTDPNKTDADYALQGEYSGMLKTDGGLAVVGIRVIALGKGKFQAAAYLDGLPGDGYSGIETIRTDGELKDGNVVFEYDYSTATLADGVMTARNMYGDEMGKLKRVTRKSPTLGKEPPADAIVLFDGKHTDAFPDGRMISGGLLTQGTTSRRTFGDHKLHIEFRLPYQPEDRGQARGNSGIYLQGRYEVQMLDSFGLPVKHNECGGIYERKAPDVNMCFPPLTWQTYDIDFTAAKYDATGKLTANPRLTVLHNGHVIHDDVELPNDEPTRAAPVAAGPKPGPVYLQDHSCPVRYRNIWVVEK